MGKIFFDKGRDSVRFFAAFLFFRSLENKRSIFLVADARFPAVHHTRRVESWRQYPALLTFPFMLPEQYWLKATTQTFSSKISTSRNTR